MSPSVLFTAVSFYTGYRCVIIVLYAKLCVTELHPPIPPPPGRYDDSVVMVDHTHTHTV